ncbi:hypothetical protein BKG75_11205 [Mycobacteroides chelonae]|nr:hypothetical protein BKG75_11205 [Mycobacteroides chelonae]
MLDNFTMPGYTIPGFRRNAAAMAAGGIYDPVQHLDEVVMPVLREWRIFERIDIDGDAKRLREDLHRILTELRLTGVRFEDVKAKYLQRNAERAQRNRPKAIHTRRG